MRPLLNPMVTRPPENHLPDPGGCAYGHFYDWWDGEGVPALGSSRRLVFKFDKYVQWA